VRVKHNQNKIKQKHNKKISTTKQQQNQKDLPLGEKQYLHKGKTCKDGKKK